ncbi:MAG: hypothetical protein NTX23_08915 [Candidatus Bipolaricaulota bacterium]|nr:hypothetical protein [Candidatus Bipolaricaulota bacterium]
MRRVLLLAAGLIIASGVMAQSVGLGPVALGFHLIPSIEKQDGRLAWDLSLSLGIAVTFGSLDSLEFSAITDSGLTALGTTVTYHRDVTDHVGLGAGVTVLWPITGDEKLQTPLFESFARANLHDSITSGLSGEVSASLPFLTVAKTVERWSIVPLAELPSVALAGDIYLATHGSLKLELTLQPVITDTTLLVEPFGRVTDDLLILPMLSAFTRFLP